MLARVSASAVAAAAIAGFAVPAAAEKIDFKTVPTLECKVTQVHMCGAAEKCEGGPGQHIARFDLDKDSLCFMAGPGAPCEKPAKFEAYEGGMLPGILVVARSNRSMFHIGPEGAMTGSQIAAGAVINMIGTCVGKGR
jgi:hypothetical protein